MKQLQQYSIIGVLLKTIKLGSKIFEAWKPLVIYAVPITLLSLLADTFINYCGMAQASEICTYLANPVAFFTLVALYVLIYLHLFLACAVDFYDEAFNNQPFKIQDLLYRSKSKWLSEIYICGCLIFLAVLFGISIKFLLQSANPDWKIELIYFCIIFTCVMFCLLLIRVAAAISIYLNKGQSSISVVLQRTAGKAYVAVILFLVLFGFELLSAMRVGLWLDLIAKNFPILLFVVEYFDIIIKLGFAALMLIFFRAQQELLISDEHEI